MALKLRIKAREVDSKKLLHLLPAPLTPVWDRSPKGPKVAGGMGPGPRAPLPAWLVPSAWRPVGGGRAHLEVALVGVEDEWLLHIELALHFQCQAANGRLEVGLLSIHHQPHAHLAGFLQGAGAGERVCLGSGRMGPLPWVHPRPSTLARTSILCSILVICSSSSSVNRDSRGSRCPV